MVDEPARTHETYLGDGAYAALEDGVIVLYTTNGVTVENRVVFEDPRHAQRLVRAVQDLLVAIGHPCP